MLLGLRKIKQSQIHSYKRKEFLTQLSEFIIQATLLPPPADFIEKPTVFWPLILQLSDFLNRLLLTVITGDKDFILVLRNLKFNRNQRLTGSYPGLKYLPSGAKKLFMYETCFGKWKLSIEVALHYKKGFFPWKFPIPDFSKNIQSLKNSVYCFIVYKVFSYATFQIFLPQLSG